MPARKPARKTVMPPMPPGPNPHRDDPMQVKPFGRIWAVVEGLGVISLHRTREEADEELKARLPKPKAEPPAQDGL
jgi:hypothetical protein